MANGRRSAPPPQRPGRGRRGLGLIWGIILGLVLIGGGIAALSILQPIPVREFAAAPADATAPDAAAANGGAASDDPDDQDDPDDVTTLALAGPALRVNARAFASPSQGALISVVLRDMGSGTLTEDALGQIGVPVTIAVQSAAPGGRALALAARRAGHEVLAEIPVVAVGGAVAEGQIAATLPAGEIEARTLASLKELDLAIGMTVPVRAAVIGDQKAMAAMLDAAAPHGFAWVEPGNGLNSVAGPLAEERGIVSVRGDWFTVADASEQQVYATLENAAAQARRDGTAIVVIGASTPALRGLVRWGLERTTDDVRLAPLSATIARRIRTAFR